ncbi:MAG TPA: hypothetical protein DEP00_05955 [Lachnospiraceae bacterium]|nr:hypothetical protein [Lachnospiraceae bacterium]
MEESMDMNQLLEQDTAMRPVHNGQLLTGEVVENTGDQAILNVGRMYDGVLTQDQLPEGETLDQFPVGTQMNLSVVKVDTKNSQIILSKKDADRVKVYEELNELKESGAPLTVKVISVVKGGLRVRYKGVQGFVPASHVDTHYTEDLDQFVGKEIDTEVMEVNQERREFTASRRNLLKKQREEAKAKALATLKVGDRVEGTVVRIEPYGAFIEIMPGVSGLLHISDMSWSRIKHPSNVLKMGDHVVVGVNQVDQEKGRIGLSLKDVTENPWENLPFQTGDIIDGCTVNRIISSGAFVQVSDQLEGFLPISQIADRRLESVNEVLKVGDLISVRILNIDKDQLRLSVSMKGVDQQNVNVSEPAADTKTEEAENKAE